MPRRLALLLLPLLLCLGCGSCRGHSQLAPLPHRAPRVESWPRHRYEPQPLDRRASGDKETPKAAEIRSALEARYGEPFVVPLVSTNTFSAPGLPGGVEGDFEAHPVANPALYFGGSHHGELVDNYACIRAVHPVVQWARGAARERVVVATHRCERSGQVPSEVELWVFDASGASVDERVAELRSTLTPVLDPLAHAAAPLSAAIVTVSFHAPGSAPTLRKVVTTSRRPEHARYWVRRREHAAVQLRWSAGSWTRRDEVKERVKAVEAAADAAVRPGTPPNASFEVLMIGPPEATIEQLASRPTVREDVDVFVRITGAHDEQALADWVVAAQNAIDPRLLLHWHVTLCDEDAGSPWADPERCQRGWEGFTVFTLDEPRRPPDYWPYPPAGGPARVDAAP